MKEITAQQYICDLNPYQPGLPVELVAQKYGIDPAEVVKLASNENPLGASPKAKTAAKHALSDAHRYPDQYNLTQALASHYDIDASMVVIGNGSNDVLDLTARTFLGEGCEAISSQYAFLVYQIVTQSVGAGNSIVGAMEYGHDLDAMLAAITPKTRLIWIANPNNPTGTFVPYSKVRQFSEQVPDNVVVVLDEAYYEYLPAEEKQDAVQWLADFPNLILVRTFSKIYGLAGLRVGYGLMNPNVANLLNRVRQPFNVSSVALASATAALKDTGFISKSAETNRAGRKQLLEGLADLRLEHLPSHGNFVTFKAGDAPKTHESLLKQGIITRPLGGYGMSDWLRVSIGLAGENQRFLMALAKAR